MSECSCGNPSIKYYGPHEPDCTWWTADVCDRCKGRRWYGYTVPGNEGVPEYDVDDQVCPDCNPNAEGRAP